VKGGHSPTEVPRLPVDVLDRHVDGERRRPVRRQLPPVSREDEVLGAVGGLEVVVRQREARNRDSHLPAADGQFRVGVQRKVLARRERQARRVPESSVQIRPRELVIGGEVVVVRHGFLPVIPPSAAQTVVVCLLALTTNERAENRQPDTEGGKR
jgi:hypothetical protein